ncbi:MAG: MmgE/PrpD family protein [Hyphomonadaceae bacterium]
MADDRTRTPSRRDALGVGVLGAGAMLGACVTGPQTTAAARETPITLPAGSAKRGDGRPLTPTISAYIANIRTAQVDPEFLELGKRHILDTLAAAVSCKDLEPAMLGRKYALSKSADAKNGATMLATKERVGLVDAAYGSAMIVHGSEINDFIPSAFVQPGPAVVGTAFAIAEARGGSGSDLLRACVAGYELCGRIPKALGVRTLVASGLANHSVGPCFGAAATAASMLRLPAEKIPAVMSYAAQQASGSWQWLLDNDHVEKTFVFAGVGARNGIEAALLVESGYTGVMDCFDNPQAFMNQKLFRDGPDHDPFYLIEDLDTRSELHDTAYKRYPVGGPTQPAVQAVLELLPKTSPETVESIVMEMPGRWDAFRNAEMPALNLRYLASIILIDGRLDLVSAQDRERFNTDARVKALMERMDVKHAPDLEVAEGEERTEPARVRLVDRKSGTHELFVPFVRGFPSHPMTRQDVTDKAMELMWPVLGRSRASEVVDAVMNIEQVSRAADIVPMIAS